MQKEKSTESSQDIASLVAVMKAMMAMLQRDMADQQKAMMAMQQHSTADQQQPHMQEMKLL